jgi:predicted O-linked N-acetylglucosamine transferase (SPINDLY family)
MGAPYVDCLIADSFVIPAEQRRHYSERILYLPECFQANDDRRSMSSRRPAREELRLPPSALVLCCFNGTYKINPPLFDIWMRALQACSDSVLWLLAPQPVMRQNLAREAQRRGVVSARAACSTPSACPS